MPSGVMLTEAFVASKPLLGSEVTFVAPGSPGSPGSPGPPGLPGFPGFPCLIATHLPFLLRLRLPLHFCFFFAAFATVVSAVDADTDSPRTPTISATTATITMLNRVFMLSLS